MRYRILLGRFFIIQAAGLFCAAAVFAQPSGTAQTLTANQATERSLSGGQKHLYSISAKKDEFISVIADQRGVDIIARIYAPDGSLLLVRDAPNGSIGAESVSFVAADDGNYRLEIAALDEQAQSGKYQLKLENPRRPKESDRLRVRTEQSFADAMNLRSQNTPDSPKQARIKLEESLKGFQELSDKYYEAITLVTLAFAVLDANDGEKSLTMVNRALSLAREISDRHLETLALINTGDVYGELKNSAKAIDFYTQATTLAKNLGDTESENLALKNAAAVYSRDKQWQKAIDANQQIADSYRRAGNRDGEANTLNIIGVLYSNAADRKRAVEFYAQAGAIFRELKNAESEALTFSNAGIDYKELGENEKALAAYRQALTLQTGNAEQSAETLESIIAVQKTLKRRDEIAASYQTLITLHEKGGDSKKTAKTYRDFGNYYAEANEDATAVELLREAVKIYQHDKNFADAADVLNSIAAVYQKKKDTANAVAAFKEAEEIYKTTDDVKNQAVILNRTGVAYSNADNREKAMAAFQEALKLVKSAKDKQYEAQILFNIGAEYSVIGKPQSAIDNFKDALVIRHELNLTAEESETLRRLAGVYREMLDYDEALKSANQSLELSRQVKSKVLEAESLTELGDIYANIGKFSDSEKSLNDALKIARELKNESLQANALHSLAITLDDSGDKATALKYHKESLEVFKRLDDKFSVVSALDSIGKIYAELGSNAEAIEFFQKALPVAREIGGRDNEGLLLARIGASYMSLNDYAKALSFMTQAIPILEETKQKYPAATNVINIAILFSNKSGDDLPLLSELDPSLESIVHLEGTDADNALKFFQMGLKLAREINNRNQEAVSLEGISSNYYLKGDYENSLAYLQQALSVARSSNARSTESSVLANMMILEKQRDNKNLAIFYGKQSVNIKQELRANIKNIDADLQKSFLNLNKDTYRTLADLLIAAGRLPEANQILAMLKEEELSGFVRRDAKEIETLSKRADLRADEKSALERYNLFSSKVTAIGAEFAKLDDVKRRLSTGETFAEQARYDELAAQLKDANTAFRVFLEKELAAELGKDKKKEIEQDRALQGKLKSWGAGTVALSTIVGEDRYRVILTTPNAAVDGKTEIKAADLNAKIFAFREALLNPTIDPKPLGKELYDILIKPIEKDLDAAGAKTLLWSLDGTLRYIPIAALWDGKQYLLQKYQTVIVTSTTRQSLQADVNKNWQILGAGVTKASEVTDANTAQKFSFDELKSVAQELSAVVGDNKSKGVSTGVSLIDTAFTENALKDELMQTTDDKRRFNVVHFATHFRLGSDTADSFLLLGNNKALTLAEVADSPEMNLTDVELVTLSACNTGFGGLQNSQTLAENNGKEVDSLAQFIELRGAKSVMATLWSVADESTAILMGEFYRLRKENQNWTKSETLRQAQLELLNGKYTPAQIAERNRSEAVRFGKSAKDMPKFVKDENAPFAHPFYWSPFVLIGNWR